MASSAPAWAEPPDLGLDTWVSTVPGSPSEEFSAPSLSPISSPQLGSGPLGTLSKPGASLGSGQSQTPKALVGPPWGGREGCPDYGCLCPRGAVVGPFHGRASIPQLPCRCVLCPEPPLTHNGTPPIGVIPLLGGGFPGEGPISSFSGSGLGGHGGPRRSDLGEGLMPFLPSSPWFGLSVNVSCCYLERGGAV